ncbi:Rrf2 family transcriptional regulator [Dehalogenimonas sp. THU2]
MTCQDLARRNRISEQYLVQLLVPLRIAQLVKSVRGVKGGFLLTRPPQR